MSNYAKKVGVVIGLVLTLWAIAQSMTKDKIQDQLAEKIVMRTAAEEKTEILETTSLLAVNVKTKPPGVTIQNGKGEDNPDVIINACYIRDGKIQKVSHNYDFSDHSYMRASQKHFNEYCKELRRDGWKASMHCPAGRVDSGVYCAAADGCYNLLTY